MRDKGKGADPQKLENKSSQNKRRKKPIYPKIGAAKPKGEEKIPTAQGMQTKKS